MISRIAILFATALFSAAACAADVYDPSTGTLTIPQVQIGQTYYNNVVVKLNNITVESVGSTAPVSGPVSQTCTSANFTTATYNAIAVGMTLDQVNQAVGCAYSPNLTQRATSFTAFVWSDSTAHIIVYFDASGSKVTLLGTTYKTSSGF